MQRLPEEPLASINAKIEYYQQELEELKNQKEFPYLYIMVVLPVTAVFLLLAVISDGLVDFTAAITGALFFSLLITCAYLVLYQPNREELENQIQRQLATLYREKSKLEAGLKGEREVAYILSWLPKEFITINNVYLAAGDLEVQQFDHIVVGPPGVIHLETKTINGAVLIDPKGNWTVLKASQNKIIREGMDSPLPQMQRHEMILQNFLQQEFPGENIPIYGIVVMGNSRTIVEGEDPRLTVLKRDKLNEYIKSLPAPAPLSQDLINKIALALIEHHRDLS